MQTLQNIQLVPVIDLYPADLGEPFPYPSTTEERHQHWKKVLAKFGIGQLEPIGIGYNMVNVANIDDDALEKLILMAINGIETEEDEEKEEAKNPSIDLSAINEQIELEEVTGDGGYEEEENLPTSFEGGVAMFCDGKVFITPQCCVSLQDHQEWLKVLNDDPFGMIWIGHPWICYLQQGDNILLTGLIEKDFFKKEWRFYHPNEHNDLTTFRFSDSRDSNTITPADFRYSIAKIEFKKAITKLTNQLTFFKNRIKTIAEKLNFDNPQIIANCLVDGDGELLSYSPENNVVRFVK